MFHSQPIFQQLDTHPMAHCATLAELPDGRLMAAWFAGAFETAPNQVIMVCTLPLETETWSPPRVVVEWPSRAVGQPVLLVHPTGELWLFFVVIMGRDWTSSQPYVQRSADLGRTWSSPEHLMDRPGLMFRSKPLLLNGRILVPAYDENRWESLMMLSDDGGRTWRLTAPIRTPQGNIHPAVVHMGGERLIAYLRTGGQGGVIWRAESLDLGETWQDPTPTAFPNPNSGIDLIRLRSGNLVLAYNPSPTLRTPLAVALGDAQERWHTYRILEDALAEFSYPTLLQHSDGTLHLVYTYQRRHIQHAWFSEEWLQQGHPLHVEHSVNARTC